MVLISCPLEKLANAHCTSTVCTVYTHTHSTIGLCSSCQNATKHLMENQLIYCIIKNVIYKYPPSFLTLHAFYKLVCYTVLIEAMCAAIFPQKTTMSVCLGFCFHTSSMPLLHNFSLRQSCCLAKLDFYNLIVACQPNQRQRQLCQICLLQKNFHLHRIYCMYHRIIDDRMENSIKGRRIGDNLH